MDLLDIETVIPQYVALQGRLVRTFLSRYNPNDIERFRDVSDGSVDVDGMDWRHRRHGAGILFLSARGVRVNAHLGMVQYPEGIDGGRLFEYLESQAVRAVTFRGSVHVVGKVELDTLLNEMGALGVLRRSETTGRLSHGVFEVEGNSHGE